MTNSYQINAYYAVSKAKEAVESWKEGVAKAEKEGTAKDIEFCKESLRLCEERLAWVKKDVKDNWHAYL